MNVSTEALFQKAVENITHIVRTLESECLPTWQQQIAQYRF